MPKIKTPICIVCHHSTIVEITDKEYTDLVVKGLLMQNALPTRPVNFREMMISGTHDGCWMTLYYRSLGSQRDFALFLDALFDLLTPRKVMA